MVKTRGPAVLFLTALGLIFTLGVQAIAGPPPPPPKPKIQASAKGATYITGQGNTAVVDLSAGGSPTNAIGTVHVVVAAVGTDWKGTVNCYYQQNSVAGNKGDNLASMSGQVTSGTAMGSSAVGSYFQIVGQDNDGQPGGRKDQIVVDRRATPFDCTQVEAPIRTLTKGSIQVSGAATP